MFKKNYGIKIKIKQLTIIKLSKHVLQTSKIFNNINHNQTLDLKSFILKKKDSKQV